MCVGSVGDLVCAIAMYIGPLSRPALEWVSGLLYLLL